MLWDIIYFEKKTLEIWTLLFAQFSPMSSRINVYTLNEYLIYSSLLYLYNFFAGKS